MEPVLLILQFEYCYGHRTLDVAAVGCNLFALRGEDTEITFQLRLWLSPCEAVSTHPIHLSVAISDIILFLERKLVGMFFLFVPLLGGVHCMSAGLMFGECIQQDSLGEVKYLAYLHANMCG